MIGTKTIGLFSLLAALLVGIGFLFSVAGPPVGGKPWTRLTERLAPDPFADQRPRAEDAPGVTMPGSFETIRWLKHVYSDRVTLFAELAPLKGGVAFVGDSLTEFGRWADAYPGLPVRNFGIAGDTTLGLRGRLTQIIEARPARVFWMIGTNDLDRGTAPGVIARRSLAMLDDIRAALPRTKIIVQSVLPRTPAYAPRIGELNRLLDHGARARGMLFVDLHAAFAIGDGRLDPTVSRDDLHLSGAGYARWRRLIAPFLEQEEVITPRPDGRKTGEYQP